MVKRKKALITGITGQDGSYLAEFLLKKGYEVTGIVRKTSHFLYANIANIQHELSLIQADLLDPVSLREAIQKVKPDEVYNLASQSSPGESSCGNGSVRIFSWTALSPLRKPAFARMTSASRFIRAVPVDNGNVKPAVITARNETAHKAIIKTEPFC